MTTDSYKWFGLIGLLVTGWLVYLMAPILTPILVAALLAGLVSFVPFRHIRERYKESDWYGAEIEAADDAAV